MATIFHYLTEYSYLLPFIGIAFFLFGLVMRIVFAGVQILIFLRYVIEFVYDIIAAIVLGTYLIFRGVYRMIFKRSKKKPEIKRSITSLSTHSNYTYPSDTWKAQIEQYELKF